ncbi:MAG: hypothetical protein M1830_009591 [Pleopsidium flavum]|nr:MAG: hypothetical protein M1830_009591 [Pleopsidium flavum]
MDGVSVGNMMKGHAESPYGARLLPQVADEIAKFDPYRIYASVPHSADVTEGFREVNFLELAHAVNHIAWWLHQEFGRSNDFETLAYMGISDTRYTVIFLAAVKCGYKRTELTRYVKLLVPSIRNSLSMNKSLLEETKCTKFFFSSEMAHKVHKLQDGKTNVHCYLLPTFGEMLDGHTEHYPYEESFAEAQWDPVLVCHTSGSTGAPKPIVLNHGLFSVLDNHRNIPKIQGRKNQDYSLFNFEGGGRFYSSYPPFHSAGFVAISVLPIIYTATVVLGPPDRPASGQLISQIMHQYDIRAIFCAPALLEQLLNEPKGLEQAKRLDFVLYTGGPLSPSAGDQLSRVSDICQLYGQTETGVIPALVPLRENWSYFEWHPTYENTMELISEDVYEMVIHRDPSLAWIRGICHTFPDVEEWRTRDLFKPHPSNPNLWRFHGRTDDILVLSNGEKFNPVPMESIIQGHESVSGALIVGQGRFQAALLVEPRHHGSTDESFIDEIWPSVEHANVEGPGHAKILRSKIVVTSPEKPFSRAGKGTVVRGATTKLYAGEIESLYANKTTQKLRGDPVLAANKNLEATERFVRTCAALFFPDANLTEADDFFSLGLDSLQTIELASRMKAGLRHHPKAPELGWLSTKTIYTNPTISSLTNFVHSQLHSEPTGDSNMEESREARMDALIEKYTRDLPEKKKKGGSLPPPSKLSVALTGSTGSLGSHLLRVLLDDPNVSKVYCLNRSADAQKRHEKNFTEQGLDYALRNPQVPIGRGGIRCSITSPKAEFIKVDFGRPRLGLSAEKFAELTNDVNVIIHNAWKVDFNHSLESFEETHIRGVRNFIDWSIDSPLHPHIFFVSSISSVGNWAASHGSNESVTEIPVKDSSVAQALGYGESKHVSERILDIATTRSGVPASILRVGQIAGSLTPSDEAWNRTEWMPCLIKTSQALGRIPAAIPDIDWIPVNKLVSIILELVHTGVETDTPQIFNLVNPTSAPWSSLVAPIQKRFGPECKVVPLAEWIDVLKQVDMNDKDELSSKPALKILDFYVDLEKVIGAVGLTYDTEHGLAASETMASLPGVSAEWMETWLEQWDF